MSYNYPAIYHHTKSDVVVNFTANKVGKVMVLGNNQSFDLGDIRNDWTGPENNTSWVLVVESKKIRLHKSLGKLKDNY